MQADEDEDMALGSFLMWDENDDATAPNDLEGFSLKEGMNSILPSSGDAPGLLTGSMDFSEQIPHMLDGPSQQGNMKTDGTSHLSSSVQGQHVLQQRTVQQPRMQVHQQQQSSLQPQLLNPSTMLQQAPQGQTSSIPPQSSSAHNGALRLLQQGQLTPQQQQLNQSMMMQQKVSQQGGEHANFMPQFPFGTDPSQFMRQLRAASIQQQQPFSGTQIQQQAIAPAVDTAQRRFSTQAAPGNLQSQSTQEPESVSSQKILSASSTAPQAAPVASAQPATVNASESDASKAGSCAAKLPKKSSSVPTSANRKKAEIDMSSMTTEEKAKANRDRNREHARNTRLRKKAYLEKLKKTVDELCRERDSLVNERAGAASVLVEVNNKRKEAVVNFFAIRTSADRRRELWANIVDETCFTFLLPVTPYRSFPASEVQVSKCQRTIMGIEGIMADSASLHVLLNSLVDRSRFPHASILFRYTIQLEDAVVSGNQMMARWVMSTTNAVQCGAKMDIVKQGMLCCKFNANNKITSVELIFDVMALMLQLKQAAGADTFSVIPNTVQTCQRSFDKPMVMTLAEEPYTIVQVNKLWEEMTGYKAEDVVGKSSFRLLEGEGTDPRSVESLLNEIRYKRPASAMLSHYRITGETFKNFFIAYPLSTDSKITHYLHLSTYVDICHEKIHPNEMMGNGQDSMLGVFPGTTPHPEYYNTGVVGSQRGGSVGPQSVYGMGGDNGPPQTSMNSPFMGPPNTMSPFQMGNRKRTHSGMDDGPMMKHNKGIYCD